jgi:hypothetical protein
VVYFVILNEVKDLRLLKKEILRFAQNDNSSPWGILQEALSISQKQITENSPQYAGY